MRQADPGLLPHTIGFGSPNKAGGIQPRRAAGQGRGGGHPRGAGLDAGEFEIPQASTTAGARATGGQRGRLGCRVSPRTRPPSRPRPRSSSAAWRRIAGRLGDAALAFAIKTQQDGPTIASRKASQNAIEAFAAAAGAGRRFGRPRAFQPDPVEGQQVGRKRRPERQLHLFRRARIRHDRDQQRLGAAWRLRALRRHLPGVPATTPATRCG